MPIPGEARVRSELTSAAEVAPGEEARPGRRALRERDEAPVFASGIAGCTT